MAWRVVSTCTLSVEYRHAIWNPSWTRFAPLSLARSLSFFILYCFNFSTDSSIMIMLMRIFVFLYCYTKYVNRCKCYEWNEKRFLSFSQAKRPSPARGRLSFFDGILHSTIYRVLRLRRTSKLVEHQCKWTVMIISLNEKVYKSGCQWHTKTKTELFFTAREQRFLLVQWSRRHFHHRIPFVHKVTLNPIQCCFCCLLHTETIDAFRVSDDTCAKCLFRTLFVFDSLKLLCQCPLDTTWSREMMGPDGLSCDSEKSHNAGAMRWVRESRCSKGSDSADAAASIGPIVVARSYQSCSVAMFDEWGRK